MVQSVSAEIVLSTGGTRDILESDRRQSNDLVESVTFCTDDRTRFASCWK